jgi:hypothetical protein
MKSEIEAFFLASTAFENKHLQFMGWSGPDAAEILVSSFAQATRVR